MKFLDRNFYREQPVALIFLGLLFIWLPSVFAGLMPTSKIVFFIANASGFVGSILMLLGVLRLVFQTHETQTGEQALDTVSLQKAKRYFWQSFALLVFGIIFWLWAYANTVVLYASGPSLSADIFRITVFFAQPVAIASLCLSLITLYRKKGYKEAMWWIRVPFYYAAGTAIVFFCMAVFGNMIDATSLSGIPPLYFERLILGLLL